MSHRQNVCATRGPAAQKRRACRVPARRGMATFLPASGRNCAGEGLSVHSPLVLEGILAYDTAFRPKMSLSPLPGRPLSSFGRLICVFAVGLFVGLLALAASVHPDPRGYGTHEQLGLPPCAFQLLLKIPCPTCGGTTSFAHFVRGEWRSAFLANSAAFAFALLTSLLIPWLAVSAAMGRLLGVDHAGWTLVVVVGVLTVLALLHWMMRIMPVLR